MTDFKKIFLGTGCVVGLYLVALNVFPHNEVHTSTIWNRITQVILFFVTLYLFLREPRKSNKFIFLNFLFAFSVAIFNFSSEFFGVAFLSENRFASFIFWEYSSIGMLFFFAMAIVYLVIDSLFQERSTFQKYASSIAIILFFFSYSFLPLLIDPLSVYKTEDIKQWKELDNYIENSAAATAIQSAGDLEKLAIDLSNHVRLKSWKDGIPVGELYPDQNYNRIKTLIPYLAGDTYQILVVRPIYKELIEINVLLVGVIILFFGYQYAKDPPQGAYIDKIMFVLLLFCSMEILHNWAFIKSLEWSTWNDLFNIGQYITITIEGILVFFFALRLRFISSVQGEYYETEIAVRPQQITRWRDWVDNMILAHFFNWKIFNGRMFQDTSAK